MKQSLNPAVAGVIVVIAVVVLGWFLYNKTGPRTDGPKEPINMGKMMGKGSIAPPTKTGTGNQGPGQPKAGN